MQQKHFQEQELTMQTSGFPHFTTKLLFLFQFHDLCMYETHPGMESQF